MNSYSPKEIQVPCKDVLHTGVLTIPENARGIILFAHGTGSGRNSPRNRFVAEVLNKKGFATLLIDLLTKEEDETYKTRFDIGLLTERLKEIVAWLQLYPETKKMPIGLFGASTGAAATLNVASRPDAKISAVVSRGGRPDLTGHEELGRITIPVLLIVGGNDEEVLRLNKETLLLMKNVENRVLKIIPKATHLFEEPGTLEEVAKEASEWFEKYL